MSQRELHLKQELDEQFRPSKAKLEQTNKLQLANLAQQKEHTLELVEKQR
jgi:hypothetical protein